MIPTQIVWPWGNFFVSNCVCTFGFLIGLIFVILILLSPALLSLGLVTIFTQFLNDSMLVLYYRLDAKFIGSWCMLVLCGIIVLMKAILDFILQTTPALCFSIELMGVHVADTNKSQIPNQSSTTIVIILEGSSNVYFNTDGPSFRSFMPLVKNGYWKDISFFRLDTTQEPYV